jgi:uncharacterized membrane protein YedE/YeeE
VLDNLLIVGGVAVSALTALVFWFCLPRGDRRYRFVETELEPYIAVLFTGGFALGFTMVLAGILGH